MKSYLVCINQSCLYITKVNKKMQLSNDNWELSVGLNFVLESSNLKGFVQYLRYELQKNSYEDHVLH